MDTSKDRLLTYLLTPLSWLYGLGVYVRNKLFDTEVFKEKEYDIPVITVGNITVGGAGKTPHVEYIAEKLADVYNLAVLSRGYKRKTKGFILANNHSTPDSIGDEPYQIWRKLGNRIKVAVCEKRTVGIDEIRKLHPEVNLIILDDAFQHRWVKPKVNILLINFKPPIYEEHLLPLGRLRESLNAKGRADMIIYTKCPQEIKPITYRLYQTQLSLMAFQKLYFSRIVYLPLKPVFPDESPYTVSLSDLSDRDSALLLTGIAQPRSFVRYMNSFPFKSRVKHFSDHHDFTRNDIVEVESIFESLPGERKIILTTEKDAVRLAFNPYFPESLKPFVFYQPITIDIGGGVTDKDFISDLRSLLGR